MSQLLDSQAPSDQEVALALAKRWAEYLTIVTTASLMPVELYELYARLTWPRGVVLVVNIVVVAYLVVELKRTKKGKEG